MGETLMKKAELEQLVCRLEARIIALETRPQFNYCGCNHACSLPHYPQPYYPTWTVTSGPNGGLTENGTLTVS
jgi:hypothetical protein